MQRKNKNYNFIATQRHFSHEQIKLHKFYKVNLSEALDLIRYYLSPRVECFPFLDTYDFQFGVDGLCQMLKELPPTVTALKVNVRYLLNIDESEWIKLIQSVPAHVVEFNLQYMTENEEWPGLDWYYEGMEREPNAKQLKMFIKTAEQFLPENVKIVYDFKRYGVHGDDFDIRRPLDLNRFFGEGRKGGEDMQQGIGLKR